MKYEVIFESLQREDFDEEGRFRDTGFQSPTSSPDSPALPWTSVASERMEEPMPQGAMDRRHGRSGDASGMGGGWWSGPANDPPSGHPQDPRDAYDPDDVENEPPLLQELGIDPTHIVQKTSYVLNPSRPVDETLMFDSDLGGPIGICLALGIALLLHAKVHFGYIYGFALMGCLGMTTILNLMSRGSGIGLLNVASVFGYALLPMTLLAFVSVIIPVHNLFGGLLVLSCVVWSSLAATRFFEAALQIYDMRYLIGYPTFLLYGVFALITIF